MAELDRVVVAQEMLDALDAVRLVTPPTKRYPNINFATAYAIAEEEARLRVARGERPVGRKIGYTNRAMWAEFNVHQPIWSHMYAHTVHEAHNGSTSIPLAMMVAPRIEPEIAFKLRAPPPSGCDDAESILACVEWVARSFEIVDCHYAGWKFTGPDSVIDFGHHAALVVGEPLEVERSDIARVAAALGTCSITLSRNGDVFDTGRGSNALGHPALALACLVDVIAGQPDAHPLVQGEIVTTGTLTIAHPVHAGDVWRTDTDGLPLRPLSVSF